jgi:hypothetical protein
VRRRLRCREQQHHADRHSSSDSGSRLAVSWPAWQVYILENIAAGALITAHESADNPFEMSTYLQSFPVPNRQLTERPTFAITATDREAKPGSKLRPYIAKATWCEASLRHSPKIKAMNERVVADSIEMIAIPIDPEEKKAKLPKYLAKWKPAYRLLIDLPIAERAQVTAFLSAQTGTGSPPLPMSMVTDSAAKTLCSPGEFQMFQIRADRWKESKSVGVWRIP